jgi:multiple sugar transport system permease protein
MVAQSSTNRSLKRREALVAYAFVGPVVIFFICLSLGPMIFAVYTAFHDWNGLGPMDFYGMWNFIDLFKDSYFWNAFKNTFIYAFTVVGGITVMAIITALIINSLPRFMSNVMRVSYFIPPVLSVIAASLFWRWIIYQPLYGLLNLFLIKIGIPSQGFLSNPDQAMASVIVMTVWKWTGYHTIIFIAGLQMIPDTYYDSAKVDGASTWTTIWRITLPLLKPSLLFSMIINFIGCFQIFDTVYIMTRGGPANTTTTVVYLMYDTAFGYMKFSYAATMGVVLFIVIMFVTLFQMRVMRKGGVEAY